MEAYSQNFQLLAKPFFGCHYSNFANLYLKLGVDPQEDIILILFGGRPCKTAMASKGYTREKRTIFPIFTTTLTALDKKSSLKTFLLS